MLSGGEPTLNASLVEYVRLAKAHSALPGALQTNAIRLADAGARRRAGRGRRSTRPSSRSTAPPRRSRTRSPSAPGTFDKTVVGIDNLHRAGVGVHRSSTSSSARRTSTISPAYVRLVAARWPRAFVNISFVAPSTRRGPAREGARPALRRRAADLAEAVREARAARARDRRLRVDVRHPAVPGPRLVDGYFRLADIPPASIGASSSRPRRAASCALEQVLRLAPRLHGAARRGNELRAVQRADRQ